jgi:hypothetical protein
MKNRLDYIDGADLIANKAIEQIILDSYVRTELLFKRTKGDLMAGSYTISKSEQRTPGRTPTESGINNGSGTNRFTEI